MYFQIIINTCKLCHDIDAFLQERKIHFQDGTGSQRYEVHLQYTEPSLQLLEAIQNNNALQIICVDELQARIQQLQARSQQLQDRTQLSIPLFIFLFLFFIF